MKRKILASVIGVVASIAFVAASHGQGTVFFANYNTPSGTGANADPGVNAPVTFGTTASVGGISGTAGALVGSEFSADLEYSFGGNPLAVLTAAQAGGTPYPTAFFGTDGNAGSAAGYFQGPFVTIPGYSSGPITFVVRAFNGTSFAGSTWNGVSAPFTLNSIATGTSPVGDFGPVGGSGSLAGFTVNPVPEPGIFALAGLAAAGLMGIRRKKQ